MPLSAPKLYVAAQLTPDFFGTAINFDGTTPEQQEAQAIAYIQTDILPIANSEVSAPVRTALGDYSSPLDDAGLTAIFGGIAPEVIQLWNGAEVSYGRSELNKRINSDNVEDDKDSDQDRLQGNDRVKKLVALIQAWKAAQASSSGGNSDTAGDDYVSSSIPITLSF